MSRRNILLIFLGALVGLGLFLNFLSFGQLRIETQEVATPKQQLRAPRLPAVAVISEIEGVATVRRFGDRLQAYARMELREDDVVEASPTGTLTIVWPSYGHSVIAPGSVISLRDAETSQDRGRLRVKLKLELGKVWTRLERLLGPGSSFDVRASSVVATVRGTSFGVSLERGQVNVQVLESRVGVSQVEEREPTPEERSQGIDEPVEVLVGTTVVVEPQQEIDYTIGAEAIPAVNPMEAQDFKDPIVIEGNADIPAAELEIVPLPVESFGEPEPTAFQVDPAILEPAPTEQVAYPSETTITPAPTTAQPIFTEPSAQPLLYEAPALVEPLPTDTPPPDLKPVSLTSSEPTQVWTTSVSEPSFIAPVQAVTNIDPPPS